jgi:glycosyltransferase involved in cell wall biosynthesis
MKVLHIITVNNFGGAEKLMLQLLPALNNACTVDCLIFSKEITAGSANNAAASIADRLREKGITVFEKHYHSLRDKNALAAIRHVIGEGGYHLVHSHLKYPDVWLAWLRSGKKINLPVVTTIHGYNDAYQNQYGLAVRMSKLLLSPYYYLTRWTYKRLDAFILISNIVASFFERSGLITSKKKEVIHHGYAGGPPVPYRPVGRDPQLAIPGRLLALKGHRFGIEAMGLLKTRGVNASLHIFGDGPERENISRLIDEAGLNDRVFLHGYVDDLSKRLTEMDIVLVPSLTEGFGLVVLDAFAAGRPLITFDLPACNEIVRNEHNGLLATPYSAASIAGCVERLMTDDTLAEKLVKAAYESLRVDFSMERMAGDYQRFYQQILSNRS